MTKTRTRNDSQAFAIRTTRFSKIVADTLLKRSTGNDSSRWARFSNGFGAHKSRPTEPLVELIQNAADATLAAGSNKPVNVTLRVDAQTRITGFTVIDQGTGVNQIETMLTPGKSSKPERFGIGLTSVLPLLERHEGKMLITSNGMSWRVTPDHETEHDFLINEIGPVNIANTGTVIRVELRLPLPCEYNYFVDQIDSDTSMLKVPMTLSTNYGARNVRTEALATTRDICLETTVHYNGEQFTVVAAPYGTSIRLFYEPGIGLGFADTGSDFLNCMSVSIGIPKSAITCSRETVIEEAMSVKKTEKIAEHGLQQIYGDISSKIRNHETLSGKEIDFLIRYTTSTSRSKGQKRKIMAISTGICIGGGILYELRKTLTNPYIMEVVMGFGMVLGTVGALAIVGTALFNLKTFAGEFIAFRRQMISKERLKKSPIELISRLWNAIINSTMATIRKETILLRLEFDAVTSNRYGKAENIKLKFGKLVKMYLQRKVNRLEQYDNVEKKKGRAFVDDETYKRIETYAHQDKQEFVTAKTFLSYATQAIIASSSIGIAISLIGTVLPNAVRGAIERVGSVESFAAYMTTSIAAVPLAEILTKGVLRLLDVKRHLDMKKDNSDSKWFVPKKTIEMAAIAANYISQKSKIIINFAVESLNMSLLPFSRKFNWSMDSETGRARLAKKTTGQQYKRLIALRIASRVIEETIKNQEQVTSIEQPEILIGLGITGKSTVAHTHSWYAEINKWLWRSEIDGKAPFFLNKSSPIIQKAADSMTVATTSNEDKTLLETMLELTEYTAHEMAHCHRKTSVSGSMREYESFTDFHEQEAQMIELLRSIIKDNSAYVIQRTRELATEYGLNK